MELQSGRDQFIVIKVSETKPVQGAKHKSYSAKWIGNDNFQTKFSKTPEEALRYILLEILEDLDKQ